MGTFPASAVGVADAVVIAVVAVVAVVVVVVVAVVVVVVAVYFTCFHVSTFVDVLSKSDN